MDVTGIEYIQRSIRNHLEDLHTLFTNDIVNIDLQYLNAVNMALLAAEDEIKKATKEHDKRLAFYVSKYGIPRK